jgi:hypothetical protein
MRKIVVCLSFAGALLFGLVACKDKPKPPMPNVVTYGSESVTVDSIAPDTALVVVEDTTVSVGVVTTPEAHPKHHEKSHSNSSNGKHPKGKKHPPQGKAKSQQQ